MPESAAGLLTKLEQKAAPGTAAVLVIDIQNDFVADGGFFAQIGANVKAIQQNTIPSLLQFIDEARRVGVLVVFVRAIYDEDRLSSPMRERNLRRNVTMGRCLSGSWGADFYGVAPLPGEPIVTKHRYSAVPHTNLLDLLRENGISSLLLTGVATDTCVESTGRDAYFYDFYVTLISDCCGAFDESDHLGACKRFDRDYGAVATSSNVVRAWRTEGARRDTGISLSAAN